MSTFLGAAPCAKCNYYNDNILLTGKTVQAEDGGTWWEVQSDMHCEQCGLLLNWMYEGPIILELPARVKKVEV